MSSTNKSLYYNLPVFTDNDKPSWLEDFNSAMQTIDKTMKQNADKATQAKTASDNATEKISDYDNVKQNASDALEKATSAESTANSASSKADTATQTANSAQDVANSASQTASNAQNVATSASNTAGSALSKATSVENTIQDCMLSGIATLNPDYLNTSGQASQIFATYDKISKMLYINGRFSAKSLPNGSYAKIFTLPQSIISALGITQVRELFNCAMYTDNNGTSMTNGQLRLDGGIYAITNSNITSMFFMTAYYTGEWE